MILTDEEIQEAMRQGERNKLNDAVHKLGKLEPVYKYRLRAIAQAQIKKIKDMAIEIGVLLPYSVGGAFAIDESKTYEFFKVLIGE